MLGLTACAQYPAPDYSKLDMSDPALATITGSFIKTSWPLGYEVTWVHATKEQAMRSYEDSLATVFPLKPGRRAISVAFTQAALSGRTIFVVTVKPGDRLIAKSIKRNNDFVTMWIEDQVTGKVVSDHEVVQIRSTSPTYVPIYIPQ